MRGFSFRLRPGFLCAELVAFGGVFLCPEVFFSVRSKDSVNIGICVPFFISLCCRVRVLYGGVVCLFFLGVCTIVCVVLYFWLFGVVEYVFYICLHIE